MASPEKGNRRKNTPREVKEFEEYMLALDRVTRVVKGGRRMRFRASVVIGDRAGRVGFGMGKGADVQIAMRKAVTDAQKNIITVPVVKGTITHDSKVKYKAARILAMPATEGTGVIAGGAMRKILELAGVRDVFGKSFGTNNRVVVAQATMRLLSDLRMTETAKKYVAEMRTIRDAEVAKKRAAMEESDKKPRRGKRDDSRPAAKRGVKKDENEAGRLEKELKEKKD